MSPYDHWRLASPDDGAHIERELCSICKSSGYLDEGECLDPGQEFVCKDCLQQPVRCPHCGEMEMRMCFICGDRERHWDDLCPDCADRRDRWEAETPEHVKLGERR